jgi:hypothetical protein
MHVAHAPLPASAAVYAAARLSWQYMHRSACAFFRAAVACIVPLWYVEGRVLSQQEEGTAAAQLRKDIVKQMQAQRDFLSLFIEADWETYVREMAQPGVWGGACLTCLCLRCT